MKTVLHNGKIYIERGVFCEALLIEDGYIRAAGTNDEVFVAAGEKPADAPAEGGGEARFLDCEGRTVVPGFNDSHLHLIQFSEFLAGVRIEDANSIDVIVERCRAYIAEHPDRVKNGLYGFGWNQDLFTDGEHRMLNRHDLDRISTEIPIVLGRVCAHSSAVNTRAVEMMLAEQGGKVPAVEGGEVITDETGYPTGLFNDNAMQFVNHLIPPLTFDERKQLIKEGMQYAASRGYTTLQSCDYGSFGMGGAEAVRLLEAVRDSGEMPVRYRHQCVFETLEEFEESLRTGIYATADPATDPVDNRLAFGPLKLFSDGSLGARTALLGTDYADDPGNRGIACLTVDEITAFTRAANEKGIQVFIHAIGDQAVRNVLDAYEAADPTGTNPCRNVINHVQITDRECLDRIRGGNILTAVQPIFLEYDIHMAEDRVGPELAATSYAFNTMYKEGVHQSFGTDAPVEDLAPLPNVYTAVTRKDLKGAPADGWYPNECMDIYDAVDCATIEGAYMEFAEDVKGRLKPGYLADLVILDKDIFTCPADEIKDVLPVMTMLGGEIVYERQ